MGIFQLKKAKIIFNGKLNIMKNTEIPNGYIIGYISCVTKKFTEQNCVIAGYPAKIIQNNVSCKK